MKTRTTILGTVLVLAAAATASGCTVYSEPAVAPAPAPVVETYTPQYYDGNVVYYDEVGVPYVYVGHEVRYVPRGYAHYDVLVGHYRTHAPAYHAWYRGTYRGQVRVHYRR